MIALDSNLLVYAHRQDSPWHEQARQAVARLAESRQPWAIPWPCIHEFASIVTHPRIYDPPSTLAQAIDQIEAWMESPSLVLIGEDGPYWSTLVATLERSRVAGPLVHDARIAALCEVHQVRELWTADRDFSRFAALRTRNPLVS